MKFFIDFCVRVGLATLSNSFIFIFDWYRQGKSIVKKFAHRWKLSNTIPRSRVAESGSRSKESALFCRIRIGHRSEPSCLKMTKLIMNFLN